MKAVENLTLAAKQDEESVILLQKQQEEQSALRQKQIVEKQKDIILIDTLLCSIGFAPSDAAKLAETLVLDHKIGSTLKFQKKIGSDVAGYSAILQLDNDDTELLDE